MNRREALRLLSSLPVAGMALGPDVIARAAEGAAAARQAAASGIAFEPEFFSAHEWQTVSLLVDMILPADERSGSASDAGVPEFMDFIMADQPRRQTAMRGGLAWLDREATARFDRSFVDCETSEREAILDEISWPDRAPEELSQGVAFFNSFRDLTASGFWSSRMGIEDLQYLGNEYVARWPGCPDEQLRRLGLIE